MENGVALDGCDHLVKHIKALVGIADDGVLMPHRAQSDAATKGVHRVDVLYPMAVHRAKEHGALKVAEGDALLFIPLFLVVVGVYRGERNGVHDLFVVEARGELLGHGARTGRDQSILDLLIDPIVIPKGVVLVVIDDAAEVLCGDGGDHLDDLLVHVGARQDLVPFGVDDLALTVHHVVVSKDVLAVGIVPILHRDLRPFDGTGDDLELDGGVLVEVQGVCHAEHLLAAEYAGEVVLHRDVEDRGADVPLSAATAAQLIVDTPRLVALGAEDAKSARFEHLLLLFVGLLLVVGIELFIVFPCAERLFGYLRVKAHGLHDGVVRIALLFQGGARQVIGITTQHDIGTTTCHVGGDGHLTEPACLRHNLRFAFVVLGVQDVVRDMLLL